MPDAPEREIRDALGSARGLLREWLEEGVDGFDFEPEAVAAHSVAPQPVARQRTAGHPSAPRPATPPPEARVSLARDDADAGSGPEPSAEPVHFEAHPSLAQVRETLGECTRCRLSAGRRQIVFGQGNPDADLLFVGEGPGEQEDRTGEPFVGRAGELLTQMIERGLQIPRTCCYICNIVKCRPPENRNPLPAEVAACRPFLDGQFAAVRPKVIVALGKPATSLLLGRDVAITRVRGSWQEYRGVPVMPTFHPAFVLRQYTEQNRRLVWEDLRAALARARELGADFPSLT